MSNRCGLERPEVQVEDWRRIRRRRQVAFAGKTDQPEPSQPGTGANEAPSSQSGADAGNGRPQDVVGLALSGGGLRSALFNDGFLQALSHNGLLRYVDYLCSVSGGGYVAGHLMTHTRPKKARNAETEGEPPSVSRAQDAANNFHDAPGQSHFGRHPKTGRALGYHLPAVGGYLNRSLRFFAGYCLYQLPGFLFYISTVGCISTLLAIWFRSFDEPVFRMVFSTALGVQWGRELLIAFIPTILVAVVMFALAAGSWLLKEWCSEGIPGLSSAVKAMRSAAKFLLGVLILLAVTSCAVFLGNSYTSAPVDPNSMEWNLNYFATYIAIVAGAIQILVFFGRDRLFRSELSDAANWQKVVQAVIANGVVAFLVFAMVHLMAREDISHYTANRDHYLVRGDVSNWPDMVDLFAKFASGQEISDSMEQRERATSAKEHLDFSQWSNQYLLGRSTIRRHLKHWWGIDSGLGTKAEETSIPESPAELQTPDALPVSNWWRIGAVASSCMVGDFFLTPETSRASATPDLPAKSDWSPGAELSDLAYSAKLPARNPDSVDDVWRAAHTVYQNQIQFIQDHNPILETQEFTDFLVQYTSSPPRLVPQSESLLHLVPDVGPWKGLVEFLETRFANAGQSHSAEDVPHLLKQSFESRLAALPAGRRKRLEEAIRRHDLGTLPASVCEVQPDGGDPWSRWKRVAFAEPETVSPERLDYTLRVRLNRDLLELAGVVSQANVARTPVVQPHDQNARWRWLTFWLGLLVLALIGTNNLNRSAYMFEFYRDAISKNFLRRRIGGRVHGETPISDLQPEEFGLPFPIYLASWLKLDTRLGQYRSPRSCAISPNRIALRDGKRCRGDDMSRYHFEQNKPVRLADAVAVSGSAVTPLMTRTIALSILMDFMGARLGLWFRMPNRPSTELSGLARYWWIAAWMSLAIPLATYWFQGPWLLVLLVDLMGIAIVDSFVHQRGYPQLFRSLASQYSLSMFGRDTYRSDGQMNTADARISRCWPNIFLVDGGFYDFLGVSELFQRRCDLILVSDAGVNTGSSTLESLANMCEKASSEFGVRFVDLDHDTPIDFGRLTRDENQKAPQPYLAMRAKYPEGGEALLFYAQMAITDNDPIEIQQIRYRFPSFPDEPTTNQFYTDDQVAAYRQLGYHIGSRLCSHLQRWRAEEIQKYAEGPAGQRQPLFDEVCKRLVRSYVQACYEEHYYQKDDVFGESIWRDKKPGKFPVLNKAIKVLRQKACHSDSFELSQYWLDQFREQGDVLGRYLEAVNQDVNRLDDSDDGGSECRRLAMEVLGAKPIVEPVSGHPQPAVQLEKGNCKLWAAHLSVVAAASQQLHRGIPHAVFQVGGRKKLCSLMEHLVNDLIEGQQAATAQDSHHVICSAEVARRVIQEVYELNESVFQSADHLAVVSFVQCLCKELSPFTASAPVAAASQRGQQFDLRLDFRQLLMEKLHQGFRSDAMQLIASYMDALKPGASGDYFEETWRQEVDVIKLPDTHLPVDS